MSSTERKARFYRLAKFLESCGAHMHTYFNENSTHFQVDFRSFHLSLDTTLEARTVNAKNYAIFGYWRRPRYRGVDTFIKLFTSNRDEPTHLMTRYARMLVEEHEARLHENDKLVLGRALLELEMGLY